MTSSPRSFLVRRVAVAALPVLVLALFAGCPKKEPAATFPAINLPEGFASPQKLYADPHPLSHLTARVDMDGGQHIAFEQEGQVHLLHVDPPPLPGDVEEGEEPELIVTHETFEGTHPVLVFTNDPVDFGNYRLFLGTLQDGKVTVTVLDFPDLQTPPQERSQYPRAQTLDLGEGVQLAMGGGTSEEGHRVGAAVLGTGGTVRVMALTPQGVEEGPELSFDGEVTELFADMDAKSQVHVLANVKTGEGVQAVYHSFTQAWKPIEKGLVVAEDAVADFLFSQSSQLHYAVLTGPEKLASFFLRNDWMDEEIKGLNLALDPLQLDRELAYPGAGKACGARVRVDESPFFAHMMWLDGCGGKEQSLGYLKLDIKEEKRILGVHHMVTAPDLAYDFVFDIDNYMNLYFTAVDRGHYVLYHSTYANDDRLPEPEEEPVEEEAPAPDAES